MLDLPAVARTVSVIPVLTITDATQAVPLARALVAGGLPVLEVTLRTEAAIEAIRQIAAEVPKAIVGAGTVLQPSQVGRVLGAGGMFGVSPGSSEAVLTAASKEGLPFLPGIQTVSEALLLAEKGFQLLKFFPAGAAGGLDWLKAVQGPLPELSFCPTGDIGAGTAGDYLALANVACVGGSWVAPREAQAKGDWERIERLARAAAALKRA